MLAEHVSGHEGRSCRHRRDGSADLLEDQTDLEEAEPGAAGSLRHRNSGDAGLGELSPQGAVEDRPAGGFELFQMLVRRVVREHFADKLLQRLLILGYREVHCSSLSQ